MLNSSPQGWHTDSRRHGSLLDMGVSTPIWHLNDLVLWNRHIHIRNMRIRSLQNWHTDNLLHGSLLDMGVRNPVWHLEDLALRIRHGGLHILIHNLLNGSLQSW